MADLSVVLLTMGDRDAELAAAVASARAQRGVHTEVVVVGNGGPTPSGIDADVVVELEENLGIPGGRNAGAAAATGGLVFFFDDDAELVGDDVLAGALERFAADDHLAAVGLGIVDEHGERTRRHQPRLGAGEAGPATSFPGGAVVVRAAAFDGVGGFEAAFFYALEETDLSWRLLDAGWGVRYEPSLLVRHPRTSPTRHEAFVERTARNRVWLAHRSLPWPLAACYVATWTAITGARSPRSLGAHLRGLRSGWSGRIGPRRPISWRTVVRMTRLGRPPVI
ncbi:MAG: glycosyltransferase [Actinomycetota bacterium]